MAYPNDYTPIIQYNHYVMLPHATYDEWRANTLGYGFNVDGMWGNQCWDYVANLYYQYGLTLVTKVGGGTAQECWIISRAVNSRPPFISVEGVTNIKRGDVIVKSSASGVGHICIADEDYRTSGDTSKIWCVGQNQGHGSNAPATLDEVGLGTFLGIFRNTKWQSSPTPPTPTPTTDTIKKDKFPFPIAWKHWPNFKRK